MDAPVQWALSGTIQTRSQLNWFPSPMSLWAFLVSSSQSPCCSSSLTQKDGADPDPYLRESVLVPIPFAYVSCAEVPQGTWSCTRGIPPARPRPVTSRSQTDLRRTA